MDLNIAATPKDNATCLEIWLSAPRAAGLENTYSAGRLGVGRSHQ
jgi:hypothetical protein